MPSNEQVLRKLYEDFTRGDLAAVLAVCAEDVVFHVPGRNRLAGDHRKADFPAFIGQVMALSGGTFREEVLSLLADDEYGMVLLRHSLQRGGQPIEYRTVHVWRLRGGQVAEWWEHPHDGGLFDTVWS